MSTNDLENFARNEGNHSFADRVASNKNKNPFTGSTKRTAADSMADYHKGPNIQQMLDEIDEPVEDTDSFINGSAVAEMFGWTASSTVRKKLYGGYFDGVRMKVRGGRYYYHRGDIQTLVERQEGTGAEIRSRRFGGGE